MKAYFSKVFQFKLNLAQTNRSNKNSSKKNQKIIKELCYTVHSEFLTFWKLAESIISGEFYKVFFFLSILFLTPCTL